MPNSIFNKTNFSKATAAALITSLSLSVVPMSAFARDFQPHVITADDLVLASDRNSYQNIGNEFDQMSLRELREAQHRAQKLANRLARKVQKREAARAERKRARAERMHSSKRKNNGVEAAIIAGVLGLTAGAIIANSGKNKSSHRSKVTRQPLSDIVGNGWIGSPKWLNYCKKKYRSFNPRTGRFLSYSGEYKLCR